MKTGALSSKDFRRDKQKKRNLTCSEISLSSYKTQKSDKLNSSNDFLPKTDYMPSDQRHVEAMKKVSNQQRRIKKLEESI